MESLGGHLLVAPPHLVEQNFSQTVVLLVEHTPQGAYGVILNRPTTRTIQEVWREVRGADCICRQVVNLGGPVTGPLVALHTVPDLADLEVVDGVYCSAAAEKIEELVRAERLRVRFFAGYAGWGAGQLEAECQTASWLTLPASSDAVFDGSAESLWLRMLRRAAQDPATDPPAETPPAAPPAFN